MHSLEQVHINRIIRLDLQEQQGQKGLPKILTRKQPRWRYQPLLKRRCLVWFGIIIHRNIKPINYRLHYQHIDQPNPQSKRGRHAWGLSRVRFNIIRLRKWSNRWKIQGHFEQQYFSYGWGLCLIFGIDFCRNQQRIHLVWFDCICPGYWTWKNFEIDLHCNWFDFFPKPIVRVLGKPRKQPIPQDGPSNVHGVCIFQHIKPSHC